MKFVFVSNYFNHHQKMLSDNLFQLCNGDFTFINTERITEEKIKLGYQLFDDEYIFNAYDKSKESLAVKMINEADVVIFGSAPFEFVRDRINSGKLTFIYLERPFKEKGIIKNFKTWLSFVRQFSGKTNIYFLCAGAYVSFDLKKCFIPEKKCLKWGYFPFTKTNEISKRKNDNAIVWIGRFIDWKRPKYAIDLCSKLCKLGIPYSLTFVGDGPLLDKTKEYAKASSVSATFLGALNSYDVGEVLSKNTICIFTATRKEGWGASVNEAMMNGCCVFANTQIGSVPFLIKDGHNGYCCNFENFDATLEKFISILLDKNNLNNCLINAKDTISRLWNAEVAAKRLFDISSSLLKNNNVVFYSEGPCSLAKNIRCK